MKKDLSLASVQSMGLLALTLLYATVGLHGQVKPTAMDLVPGCTTSNCSEVQAIYNVGTQKLNVDDSCVGAVH